MSGGAPKVEIGDVLRRLGIEARRAAKEWVALCPNPAHQDRSPSWRVRDDPNSSKHGLHKCWPCGYGGTLAELVRDRLKLEDVTEARKWLRGQGAEHAGPVEAPPEVRVDRARVGFHLPTEFRFDPFAEWPDAPRDYLFGRGVDDWQAERWGLGYCISGRSRSRIIIPSRDAGGRPRSYTGRAFMPGVDPKYLQPATDERASPSAMFGEQHWPTTERDLLFVVEGEINGLALEADLPGVFFGATSGSEKRPLHPSKIATWKRACFLTDPDSAGDRLSRELAANSAVQVGRLRLPEGDDCASLRALRTQILANMVLAWLRSAPQGR